MYIVDFDNVSLCSLNTQIAISFPRERGSNGTRYEKNALDLFYRP
jgi:hypothetical protein